MEVNTLTYKEYWYVAVQICEQQDANTDVFVIAVCETEDAAYTALGKRVVASRGYGRYEVQKVERT